MLPCATQLCSEPSSLCIHGHLHLETPLPLLLLLEALMCPLPGGEGLPCPSWGQNLDLLNGTPRVLPLAVGLYRGLFGGVGRKAMGSLARAFSAHTWLPAVGRFGEPLSGSPAEAKLGPLPGCTALPEVPSAWCWVLTPRGPLLLGTLVPNLDPVGASLWAGRPTCCTGGCFPTNTPGPNRVRSRLLPGYRTTLVKCTKGT